MNAEQELARLLAAWRSTPDPDLAPQLAAAAAAARATGSGAPDIWQRFLEITGESAFLISLPDDEARYAWADLAFWALRRADFGLAALVDWRVRTRPDVTFLQDLGRSDEPKLTYTQAAKRLPRIAAYLLGPAPEKRPAGCVALLSANTLDSILVDLACLTHDIPIAPLNIHEDIATLAWICDRLAVRDLIVDEPDRLQRALEIRDRTAYPFTIHLLHGTGSVSDEQVRHLDHELANLSDETVEQRLRARPRLGLDDPCTVLFTSGSTGRPKGIAFTPYNLVSKRFARAAALPAVGRDELLLCYLPLYHTFGRYLELMGMLYWGGTYVLAANPSADGLLAGMRKVCPTGLISVPLRWQQIRERADDGGAEALTELTGGRLRWGLSAAGWLAPDTFRWYHAQGVQLCSGFGMTEGTGGLTMTPPADYREDSVGLPLPGVRTRLGPQGELQVSGAYVAGYLPEDGPPGDISIPGSGDESWLGTGDLFELLDDGHLRIVDRIKDIYKNNRGQTVAPRKVEARFAGVPGITRTFLAGDGRPYNVLLIVPDTADPVLRDLPQLERDAYFQRVVRQANLDLAAYERVVNFTVLDRDFSTERGELTAKGSYRRKEIASLHATLLDHLYRRRTLTWHDRQFRVPDWVLRDLGLLEGELDVDGDALVNRRTGARLAVADGSRPGWLRLGDLEYRPTDPERPLNLGTFGSQPLLWLGNPSLQAFLPCRVAWDTRLDGVDEQVLLPARAIADGCSVCPPRRDDRLGALDDTLCAALFGELDAARKAVTNLEQRLAGTTPREALLIRRRLEALAGHPELVIRSAAYRVLVLDDPEPDYGQYLAAFVASKLPFLCEDTIAAIASGASEPRRLLSFRRRMHAYRQQLSWPASAQVQVIFKDLLQLLVDFARHNPENLATVRRELICWRLFIADPELAAHAGRLLAALTSWHHERLEKARGPAVACRDRLAFQDGMDATEIERLSTVFDGTTFLAESIAMTHDEALDLETVPEDGIWISRTLRQPFPSRYRVSVNTTTGRHFDLLLILRDDLDQKEVAETFMWVAGIRAWPVESPALPRLGAVRPDLGAATLAFADGLSVWDRIRQGAVSKADATAVGTREWRRLFVAGMATVLTAWHHSARRIVPGMVTPSNVIVPERDWQQGSMAISLAGWKPYTGPLDLMRPLVKNFLRLSVSHYPPLRDIVADHWLLEAVAEALGQAEGARFLEEFAAALDHESLAEGGADLAEKARAYAAELTVNYRASLAVESAVARFDNWQLVNSDASSRARSDQIESLFRLYRLDQEGELARFALFRYTYLSRAAPDAVEACDRLLARLFRHPQLRASRTVELSDLQAALPQADDREALARLAFPQSAAQHRPALQAVGDRAREHVVLQTEIVDDLGDDYYIREPRDAAEMGRLYRLFLHSNFPLAISDADRHLVTVGRDEQLVGGVVWRLDAASEPHLDGVVVSSSMRGRGLARLILDDFSRRLADDDHAVLRTHFSLQGFFARLGFHIDRQRGGLVKTLG